jgi:NADH dehydrogenase
MIFYPKKAKEVKDREAREAITHWGEDLVQEENEEGKKNV